MIVLDAGLVLLLLILAAAVGRAIRRRRSSVEAVGRGGDIEAGERQGGETGEETRRVDE